MPLKRIFLITILFLPLLQAQVNTYWEEAVEDIDDLGNGYFLRDLPENDLGAYVFTEQPTPPASYSLAVSSSPMKEVSNIIPLEEDETPEPWRIVSSPPSEKKSFSTSWNLYITTLLKHLNLDSSTELFAQLQNKTSKQAPPSLPIDQ